MKPDKTKRADIVYVNHTCDICHQTKDEPYELYNRNNLRHLQRFSSVCNYCTRKKLIQGEWVDLKVRRYNGCMGPVGRAWVAVVAGFEFERLWQSTGEFGVKVQMGRLKVVDGETYKGTAEDHSVPVVGTLPDDWKDHKWQDDCRDAIKKDSEMGHKVIDSAALLQIIIDATHGTTDQATLQQLPSQGFGEYKIIWDGNLVKIVLEKFKRARYYVDNVEVDALYLDSLLETSQKFGMFNSTCLVEFNGMWTLKAQFNNEMALWAPGNPTPIVVTSPGIDSLMGATWSTKNEYQAALDIVKDGPEAPCGGKVPGSEENPLEGEPDDLAFREADLTHGQDISSLASLITTSIDGAAGRDYSVLLEYKRVGDVSRASVQIDVTNVQVITARADTSEVADEIARLAKAYVPDTLKPVEEVVNITTGPSIIVDAVDHLNGFGEQFDPEAKPHKVAGREISPGVFEAVDAPLTDSAAALRERLDVGYESEFDKAMNAVYDVVQTGQLAELSPDLLRGPEWNRFYAAVKAMRKANHTTGQ